MVRTAAPSDKYDFYNPFVRASIVAVASDGKRTVYPLWVNNSAADGKTTDDSENSPLRALAFVSEVSVELQLALLPKITVTLTPPYEDAIKFLDSELMEWGTSVIEVEFGYLSTDTNNTLLSPTFSGVMLKPEVSLGQDVTITLTAQGLSGLSAQHQSGTRVFNGKTRQYIIKAIAEGRTNDFRTEDKIRALENFAYERVVEPIQSAVGEWSSILRSDRQPIADLDTLENEFLAELSQDINPQPKLTKKLGPKTRKVNVIDSAVSNSGKKSTILKYSGETINYAQGGKTDWRAIWELCEQSNCYFYWEGESLSIVPKEASFDNDNIKRTFRLYQIPGGVLGPATMTFPILSASSPTMAVYLPGATKGMFMTGVDSKDRSVKKKVINDDSEKSERTEEGGVTTSQEQGHAAVNDSTGDGQMSYPGEVGDGQAEKLAASEFSKSAAGMGVNLTLESLADPKLLPGDTVKVLGLGQRLNYIYVIFKMDWKFGGSGATMNLEMFSNVQKTRNTVKPKGSTMNPKDTGSEQGDTNVVQAEDTD